MHHSTLETTYCVNKDENIHRYEVRGEKVTILVKKKYKNVFLD